MRRFCNVKAVKNSIYQGIDFRKKPDKYEIGRGEQGVLSAEPYKSELLPHWSFRTQKKALRSAKKIYQMFLEYCEINDFVGMDMARKFLQMGWTRARRYANHPSGRKYDENGQKLPQAKDALTNEKAQAAKTFFKFFKKASCNETYVKMKKDWKKGNR